MKPSRNLVAGCCCIVLLFFLAGCGGPQRFWPQKDIIGSETARSAGGKVVLIASRASDFKKVLVEKLHERLAAADVAQKTIGVEALTQVDSDDYTAVLVISACLAWGLDHEVQTFLDRQKTDANIIVLTTSGDGTWLPDKGGRDFDAISAASKMTTVDAAARDVMVRIHSRLQDNDPTPKH